jgi:hypothetical protein
VKLHSLFRESNVRLGKFVSSLDDAVHKDKDPLGISEIQDSQFIFALLRPQFPQFSPYL